MTMLLGLFILTSICAADPTSPILSWQPDSLIVATDDVPTFYVYNVSNKHRDVSHGRELPNGYEITKSITYDSTTKTLFWAGHTRDVVTGDYTTHILSTVNNSGVVNTLHSGRASVYGLAVDSSEQLLFFTAGWDTDAVGVMGTMGDNYRSISYVRDDCFMSPSRLALDTNRRLIYVACYYRLLRMTYDGSGKIQLTRGLRIWNTALHQPTGTLFFNDNKYLYTINPPNVENPNIQLYLEQAPICVISYGSYLFISYIESEDIHVVDINEGRIISTVRNVPGDGYHWISLAYIPPDGQ